jgi:cytochrome c553
MIPLRALFLVGGLVLANTQVWANEEAASDDGLPFEDKVAACAACHGENGAKPIMPEYPILAGQHANYLAHALREYRDGRRNNPIMAAQVQALELTDSDIERLAEHFSQYASPLRALK